MPCTVRYLARPYGRVDRPKLKRRLLERCVASGVAFYRGKVRGEGRAMIPGLELQANRLPGCPVGMDAACGKPCSAPVRPRVARHGLARAGALCSKRTGNRSLPARRPRTCRTATAAPLWRWRAAARWPAAWWWTPRGTAASWWSMTSPSTQVGAILGWYSLKGGSGTALQGIDDPACVEEIGDCTA